MAVVSGLRELRNQMEISLDGVAWLCICKKHFALRPLAEGETVDPEAYADALAALQAADCYEAALTALDQAAQTTDGLRRKLVRHGFVPAAADAAVARLNENHLLDDHRYAERMAQSQLNKPVGAYSVRRKLQAKRLPQEAIEAAMADFDDAQQSQACAAMAEKLWRKYAALPPREARAKLSQGLARRGFGWNAISTAVDALMNDESWEETP